MLPVGVVLFARVLSAVGVLFCVERGGNFACFLRPTFAHVGIGRCAQVTTVVFDKTGTLTLGRPSITGVVSLDREWDKGRVSFWMIFCGLGVVAFGW